MFVLSPSFLSTSPIKNQSTSLIYVFSTLSSNRNHKIPNQSTTRTFIHVLRWGYTNQINTKIRAMEAAGTTAAAAEPGTASEWRPQMGTAGSADVGGARGRLRSSGRGMGAASKGERGWQPWPRAAVPVATPTRSPSSWRPAASPGASGDQAGRRREAKPGQPRRLTRSTGSCRRKKEEGRKETRGWKRRNGRGC